MRPNVAAITGIGSVSPYGPIRGLISQRAIEPEAITAWPTAGLRRAFLVKPFRAASVVPGLKTRRLDRLSAWALVASALALQDAGIDLNTIERSRVAVVFGTGFGCSELTEAFYLSAAVSGWGGTDPSPFPEGLANSPASHVALLHGLRGPNITVGSKSVAGESALIQAASLLRHGQADLAIVLAGDTLTRAVYEWYEVAGRLSRACYTAEMAADGGFVPSEGVAAVVLEQSERREACVYATFHSGCWAAGGDAAGAIRKMFDGAVPNFILCGGQGGPCAHSATADLARTIGPVAEIMDSQSVAAGLVDSSALLHLILGLSGAPLTGQALLLGTSGERGFAAVRLEIAGR
jgi:hypothetical protein